MHLEIHAGACSSTPRIALVAGTEQLFLGMASDCLHCKEQLLASIVCLNPSNLKKKKKRL